MHQSLYKLKQCPSCGKSQPQLDWVTWCSKCGMVVCSNCVHQVHRCRDGFSFGIPGRGTRYFETIRLHENEF
ncbi:hypothetical protein [Effusibacillus pohliae]|uniref:hypothetical protein n=1 Tax=Effusibacillus pohliae TaxID=232270 RepID=UPI00035FB6F3|nr:hypothetical protein [Effusibacillus pohliae]